jgi:hypothetical protein
MTAEAANETEAPIGGADYRHLARRGQWRCETVGPKWVTFRSLAVPFRGGRMITFKERREDWPNGWTRA